MALESKKPATELWFVGVPVPERRPGMFRVDALKMWVNNPDRDPYHFQYAFVEPDSPVPADLRALPHIGYLVSDINKRIAEIDELLWGPFAVGKDTVAFVRHMGQLIQLYQLGK